ncbi:hypothetical protein M902_1886 [Bacteriovorax sp. BAL6_X]|uniref:hypothetical protein n=1 Tax=Bacteriovorax sp. BAL6_X TaxID=1201290 RepID=UPI00038559CA|nr:hypothetical protein [Bacteriovorax sp. BAL6_X]EPZ51902.1 hypothetical protein M902_1886 [Bacteriovorax sp. BAL6_X]
MREINLSLQQIKNNPLLKGELYWSRPSGRRLLIGRAGEFVNLELVEKLSQQNDQFFQKIIIDEERVSKVVDHFMDLQKAQLEEVKLRYRNLILVDFYRALKDSEKSSTLDFVFICHETFYEFNNENINLEEQFIKTSAITFKKAQVIASSVVYLSLVSGYLDFKFLKEVFNTILLTYYSYVCRSGVCVTDQLSSLEETYDNVKYLKSLSKDFFEVDYNLNDDVSGLWRKVHDRVFALEIEFDSNDIEVIFKSILENVKDYRYFNEIFSQEDIDRSA